MRDLSREYRTSLGSLLRQAREAAGVSQLTLATALHAGDGSVISRWEGGDRYPTMAQLHDIAKELKLSDSVFQDIYFAWQRERAPVPTHLLLQAERPEALLEVLEDVNSVVKELRSDGQPRIAVQLASREAAQALSRLRQFPFSNTHVEVIRKVSFLVLQEVKAALDFLPRRHVRSGALSPQLSLLKGAGQLVADTETRFVSALAQEGATYVSGDIANSFRQTRDLLDQSERIPAPWMPEVLRAAAINAGRSRNAEALIDVQTRIQDLLARKGDEMGGDQLAYVLEGAARAWGEFDTERAFGLAQEAWVASGFDQGHPSGSALRFVQLARTQGEIELARPTAAFSQTVKAQVEVALELSRRENYDRYTDQLEVLTGRLA